ncbi:MAG: SHOCT domain-containing protein [Gaiellaceae bacterium]
MDNNAPPFQGGRGFGFGFADGRFHHGGPPALAWATFALVLLLVLSFAALLLSQFSARRALARHGGPRRFAFAGGPGSRRRPDPLDVLRHRYAGGEISRDEFLQGTSDLARDAPGVAGEPPAS